MKAIHVYSHGMGTDTCTMVKKAYDKPSFRERVFPPSYRHIVIFSDLGLEYPETYAQIPEQRRMVEEMGFEFVHLTSDMGFHPNYVNTDTPAKSIDSWWEKSGCIGMTSGDKRCTDRWKIQPIWNYISALCEKEMGIEVNSPSNRKAALAEYAKKHGKFLLTIGFAKGEESRQNKSDKLFAGAGGWKKNIERQYPLIEAKMSREDCNKYYEDQNLVPPRPSNCMFCFFQSPYELVSLKKKYPERWEQWKKLEEKKIERFKSSEKNNGVFGKFTLQHYLDKALETVDKVSGKKIKELNDKELAHRVQYHGGCGKNAM